MPTATGFGAMLAGMLPGELRYDERARAVCLRLEWALESIAPLWPAEATRAGAEANHVDAGLTSGLRRAE